MPDPNEDLEALSYPYRVPSAPLAKPQPIGRESGPYRPLPGYELPPPTAGTKLDVPPRVPVLTPPGEPTLPIAAPTAPSGAPPTGVYEPEADEMRDPMTGATISWDEYRRKYLTGAPAAPTAPATVELPQVPDWAIDLDKLDPLSRSLVSQLMPWLSTQGELNDPAGLLSTFSGFLTKQYESKPALTDSAGKPYETISEFLDLSHIDLKAPGGQRLYDNTLEERTRAAELWIASLGSWRSAYITGVGTLLAQHNQARSDALSFIDKVLDREFEGYQAGLTRAQAAAEAGLTRRQEATLAGAQQVHEATQLDTQLRAEAEEGRLNRELQAVLTDAEIKADAAEGRLQREFETNVASARTQADKDMLADKLRADKEALRQQLDAESTRLERQLHVQWDMAIAERGLAASEGALGRAHVAALASQAQQADAYEAGLERQFSERVATARTQAERDMLTEQLQAAKEEATAQRKADLSALKSKQQAESALAKAQQQADKDLLSARLKVEQTEGLSERQHETALAQARQKHEAALATAQQKFVASESAAGRGQEATLAVKQQQFLAKEAAAGRAQEATLAREQLAAQQAAMVAQQQFQAGQAAVQVQADKDMLASKLQTDRDIAEQAQANAARIVEREGMLARERLGVEISFKERQGELDRAIQRAQLDEAVRNNKALRELEQQRLSLDREIQQWNVLSSLLKGGGAQFMTMAMIDPANAMSFVQPLIQGLPSATQQVVGSQLEAPMAAARKFRQQRTEYGELAIPSASEFAAMSPDELARYEAAFGTEGRSFTQQVEQLTPMGVAGGVRRAR